MPRQSPEVRAASAVRVRRLVQTVQQALPADAPAGAATLIATQLVGALQFARALGDNAEGKAVLATVRRGLLAQYDTTTAR
jgi:TetR/AcrR family transcriptional regulator, transcriptional repressor for nem operon